MARRSLATRDQGDGEGAVREGRESEDSSRSSRARTVPSRLRDAVNFQLPHCEENTFSDPYMHSPEAEIALETKGCVTRRKGVAPSSPRTHEHCSWAGQGKCSQHLSQVCPHCRGFSRLGPSWARLCEWGCTSSICRPVTVSILKCLLNTLDLYQKLLKW